MASEQISESRKALVAAFEPHFTCKELAEQWHFSENFIYAQCVDEPGVLKTPPRSKNKRVRISIRIPLSVANRVYDRLKNRAS